MHFECPECLESGSVKVNGSESELSVDFCPFCGCVLAHTFDDGADIDYDGDDDNWTDEDEAELDAECADDED